MTNPRIEAFRAMIAKNPSNVMARFGLANEAMKEGLLEEAVENLRVYLEGYTDEGNGWSRLAEALERQGKTEEAREALRKGIEAAYRFGHAGMASDLEERLDALG